MHHRYMQHGYMHHGYMHHGYMHHGYMHHGYIHHGFMHHGYMHHGYMHHQQSESRIHALLTPSAWVTRPERPKGAKDEVKQARRAANQKSGPNGPLDFYDDHNRLIMVTLTNNIITTVMMIKNEQLVGRGSWLQSQRLWKVRKGNTTQHLIWAEKYSRKYIWQFGEIHLNTMLMMMIEMVSAGGERG